MKKQIQIVIALRAIILMVIFSTISSLSIAQNLESPKPRQGYYLSLGTLELFSSNYRRDQNTWLDPWPGGALSLRLGQQVVDWFDIGIGTDFGFAASPNYRTMQGRFSIEAQLRPFRSCDSFFIRAAAGFGFTDVSRKQAQLEKIVGQVGGDYIIALGYDLFLTDHRHSGGFAFTPVIGIEVKTGEMLSSVIGLIGFEFTFWTGLSDNQLNMPF